jgi:CCR4-NOT complex subunit CAF16
MSSSEEEDVPGCEAMDCCFKYLNDEHRKRALTPDEADAAPLVLQQVTLSLPDASRVVLVGANGAGKSTLLELLAGKRRPTAGSVLAGGVDPFYAPPGHSSLLTAAWANDLGTMVSLPVGQLLESAASVPKAPLANSSGSGAADAAGSAGSADAAAAAEAATAALGAAAEVRWRAVHLASVLEVDAAWQTGELSEGQRRRVQLATRLAKPTQLVLLDEVTMTKRREAKGSEMIRERDSELRNVGAFTCVFGTHLANHKCCNP